jgi:hypothetical protein
MKYATPKTTPSTPKALGTASDTISIAAIEPNIAMRTTPSSGFSQFVSHAYEAHAHHSAMRTRSPCSSPIQVG